MEANTNFFEDINASEAQINNFVKQNETEIKEYIKNLWAGQQVDQVDISQPSAQISNTKNDESQGNSDENLLDKPLTITDLIRTPQQTDKELDSSENNNVKKLQTQPSALQIKDKPINLQNGKVGQKYCIKFNLEDWGLAMITEISFEGLDNIGLEYFPDEKLIKGIPSEAGDHKIIMTFKRKDWEEGKPLLQREVLFIINPDPRVLWSKNIPTSEEIEYYKPDCDTAYIKVNPQKEVSHIELKETATPRKSIIAASQRGRSHAIEGKARDDDFALHYEENTEWYIMVVADGAGSAKYSREGSKIACNKVLDTCKQKLLSLKDDLMSNCGMDNKQGIGKLLQETIGTAVFEAYKAIEQEAEGKGRPIKDYSTTLLLSLCKKFDYGWFIGAWWVGDGGIGIYDKGFQTIKVMGEPDGGEFAGQTRFLTMSEIIKNELYQRMRFDIVDDFTAIILMTDGVTDPKFETDANLKRIEKWNDLWRDLNGENEEHIKIDFTKNSEQTAEQLLNWLNFWSIGNHDDRTIAILF